MPPTNIKNKPRSSNSSSNQVSTQQTDLSKGKGEGVSSEKRGLEGLPARAPSRVCAMRVVEISQRPIKTTQSLWLQNQSTKVMATTATER